MNRDDRDRDVEAGLSGISRRSLLHGGLLAGAAMLAPTALAACGSDAGGGGSTGAGPSASGGGSVAGGTLLLGVLADPNNFDPFRHQLVNFPILRTCYDRLGVYSLDFELTPQAAASWKMADDQMSSTITLVDGMTFHSGKPVTAKDIVAGIERGKDPETGHDLAGTVGFIDKATATDDTTVKLTYAQPTAASLLTDFLDAFPIVEADALPDDGDAMKSEPAGSGPFMLEEYQPGVALKLKKNPQYFQAGKPHLDGVEFRIFDDADAMFAALQTGQIHGGLYLKPRYKTRIDGAGLTSVVGPQGALIDLLYCNPQLPPFDNKKVRQAMARAIDRDRIINQLRKGVAQPVYDVFPPGSPGFDPSLLDKVAFDLDAAKKLLDESGGGRSATAYVQPQPELQQILQIIQSDLKKIGFELTIEPVDQATFGARHRAGENPMAVSAWAFSGQSIASINSGPFFSVGDSNVMWPDGVPKAYADAIAAAQKATTEDETLQAVQNINSVYLDEEWAIGIATRPPVFGLSKNVEGFAQATDSVVILTDTKLTS